MNHERLRSRRNSTQISRLSDYLGRHFDFLNTNHSVFSKNHYYHDMRSIHPWSRRPCSRFSGIPITTLRTRSCSPRLDDLARPKIKREQLIRQDFFDNIKNYAYSGVKATALTAQCSDRLIELAQPKKPFNANVLSKAVSEQALSTQTSDRTYELAKPRHNINILNSSWKNKQKS